ncbi:hypothetical protein, partial [Pseudomonas fontis]
FDTLWADCCLSTLRIKTVYIYQLHKNANPQHRSDRIGDRSVVGTCYSASHQCGFLASCGSAMTMSSNMLATSIWCLADAASAVMPLFRLPW